MIFHIAEKKRWESSQEAGSYSAESLSIEGFIHCSTIDQVLGVANRIFRSRTDLVVLKIDESKVDHRIVYENLDGGKILYPHIYGPIAFEAVAAILPFQPDLDGTFSISALASLK